MFITSINFTFAIQDNTTQTATDLEVSNTTAELLKSSKDEIVAVKEIDVGKTVKMNGVADRSKGVVVYSASFYDIYGNPLKNEDVWFTVDTTSADWGYNIKTDSKGLALLKIQLNNGNHIINAFNLETGGNATDNIKVFDVISGGKDITAYNDVGCTYKVRVFDNNGNPLKANQKVTFYVNNKQYSIKTDKNGFATLKLSDVNMYVIQVHYKNYAVVNTVYIKQVLKHVTSFKNIKIKSTIKFKIKYLGKNKKNIKIKAKLNKKTYTAKTNKKGIATFVFKTPKKVGKYPLVFSYKKAKLNLVYSRFYV